MGMMRQRENDATSWYCLRVAPRSMVLSKRVRTVNVNGTSQDATTYVFPAEEALAMRGMRPFVPTEGAWRRRSRYYLAKDRQRERRPLLTGYILIDPPEPVNWYKIMSLPIVTGVIVSDGEPVRIAKSDPRDNGRVLPRALGHVVAKHTDHAPEWALHMPTNRAFVVGDRVELFDERFKDLPITVTALGGEITTVAATMFGNEVIIKVATWKIGKKAA